MAGHGIAVQSDRRLPGPDVMAEGKNTISLRRLELSLREAVNWGDPRAPC
jgi:hypothetical protein